VRALGTAVPVYSKPFGREQAERLLWRAGFGPRRGDVAATAKLGLQGAVRSLTRPPAEVLTGPEPKDERGAPIAPNDARGHDHLWWLDRMVRSNRQLVERLTLVWHDWFATSAVGVKSQALMLQQNGLFRAGALGSFRDLLLNVTKDPAMLLWLSGVRNTKRSPNENYGRELMELFTLGAERGAYSENDVREQARALTGWTATRGPAAYDFRYEPRLHDEGQKTVFGQTGAFDWQDSCRLCLEHADHPSFFVRKLWSYFIPTPPGAKTEAALEQMYRSGYQIQPVVEAILMHPDLYNGPRMVKPPLVYTAGLLRAAGRGIDTSLWWKLDALAGQRLFYPPNVAGWDDNRWLDTATLRGRWFIALTALDPFREAAADSSDPKDLVEHARSFWAEPTLTPETEKVLLAFAKAGLPQARKLGQGDAKTIVQACLRQLVAVSPDFQTS
jgi:uncharacterized protein (DUF1800 family)